ncbi:hypothetical protein [Paenibacillus mucilaginosus]|uniref:hypothetical protein n=1 Tax=Paenibacillus mucilaginosus TaxID=61624 RepID=UPI001EE64A4E|nr:hypothetical protein [Paenibacillus mucilaginosus]
MNKGKTYIITDDRVEEEQIDLRIGKVTEYSDQEGTYWGNFSNYFPKGTELYNIKGVNIDEAIAIKINEESFIKADYKGEYAGSWFDIYWKNVYCRWILTNHWYFYCESKSEIKSGFIEVTENDSFRRKSRRICRHPTALPAMCLTPLSCNQPPAFYILK